MSAKHMKKPAKTGHRRGHTKYTQAIPSAVEELRQKPSSEPNPSTPPGTKKRVTVADIARHAGVSPTTVSITLSDRRDIAIPEATRTHVKLCAHDLGYVPNRLGKALLRGRSKLIGVLALADSYLPYLECQGGIEEELAAAGYIPLFVTSNWLNGYAQADSTPGWKFAEDLPGLSRLLEYQVEGVIFFSRETDNTEKCIEELARQNIPMVVLGGVAPQSGGVDIVGGDNEAIGQLAAEHLLAAGCTSFDFGLPDATHPLDDAVRSSFIASLEAAGHSCDDFTVDTAHPGGITSVLSSLEPPAGIFSTYDDIAALAVRTALSLGCVVPRDVAVAGMGQTALSEFNALPITSIDRNSAEIGKVAARLLIQRIEGTVDDDQPQHILIPPSLTVRSSSLSDVSWQLCPVTD
jgi:LacI family transcriptional regulator